MEIIDTEIEGLKLIKNFFAADARGSFTKLYNEDAFRDAGLELDIAEQYYSVSDKDVIRGMHFQTPPYDHNKLVCVISGSVTDVVVDLRKESKTYGKAASFILKGDEPYSLYIPKGMAHGFRSMEDGTVMLYNVTTVYARDCDGGVRWDSIGYDWQVSAPIMSERDKTFPTLDEFVSPF